MTPTLIENGQTMYLLMEYLPVLLARGMVYRCARQDAHAKPEEVVFHSLPPWTFHTIRQFIRELRARAQEPLEEDKPCPQSANAGR